jgi:prephenate dehydrogenase
VCVIGTGLIGGSLLRAARDAGRRVWGVDDAPTATQARTEGFDVSTDVEAALLSAAAEDALVVLAVPLPALRQVLGRVAASAPTCRLTDVTSVKAAAGDAAARHAPHARFVGGHPMAGSADAGWGAGRADMLRGAAWAVAADDGIDVDVWAEVAELAWACGAVVVPAAAAEHDRAIARVSHLPHVFAAVLAAVGAAGGDLALALAASSFADATRVAGSSPELVLAMVDGNCDALLGTLDEALERRCARDDRRRGAADRDGVGRPRRTTTVDGRKRPRGHPGRPAQRERVAGTAARRRAPGPGRDRLDGRLRRPRGPAVPPPRVRRLRLGKPHIGYRVADHEC